MKGRPPGTPKSDDPSKKKRKRSARERDLCDVKIKITEYFPGATILQGDGDTNVNLAQSSAYQSPPRQLFNEGLPQSVDPHLSGERFWTIQRVNGNGGNGKGDGVAGPHKHSLEKSDEIKKSTVQRYIAAQEKESKKIQVGRSLYHRHMVAFAPCFIYGNHLSTSRRFRLFVFYCLPPLDAARCRKGGGREYYKTGSPHKAFVYIILMVVYYLGRPTAT